MEKRGPGRPRKPAASKRDYSIRIRVTEQERVYLDVRAIRHGITLSRYCRKYLLDGISGGTDGQ